MNIHEAAFLAIIVLLSSNANAALVSRLGGLAYFDDVANLTWLADANFTQTSGDDADGRMNWADANNCASGLNINGVTGWRLPAASSEFFDYHASELSNLAYNVLGQVDGIPITSAHNSNYDLFINIQAAWYWHETERVDSHCPSAHIFDFIYDCNCHNQIIYEGYAWAVRDGDISAVPLPATS